LKPNDNPCRKAVNFDLDTKALKQFYPDKKHWRKSYTDIKKFMLDEGFNHRQGSGYTSKENMTSLQIDAKMLKLAKTFPWLKKCTRHMDVTNIGQSYDYLGVIKGTKTKAVPIIETKESKNKKLQQQSVPQKKSYFSREKLNKEADKIRKQPHKVQVKNRSQDRDI
jgi:cell filamentation protein